MESKEILYKPKDLYEKRLKDQYHKGAEEYFDKLAKEANTDVDLNAKHVSEYKVLDAKLKAAEKELSSAKSLKIFLIVLTVIFFIAAIICVVVGVMNYSDMWWMFIIAAVMLGLGIFLIVHISKKLNKKIEENQALANKTKEEADAKKKECYDDMASLNASFDWSIPSKVMESVTGIIDLDPYFATEKLYYLHDKFGFARDDGDNESVLGILSGNIQGNPFILKKTLEENLRDKVYHGYLTITWTTYSRDSEGHTVTHHHSQTLHATSTHPAPFYSRNTVLVYGNEAAPHLHFSRTPSSINSLDEKGREKEVKKKMKEIRKKADEAIESGKTFTQMDNDEFEVFFGGTNRDNEVEFRLLFTPLAQTNMMALLSDPNPYGDDFTMIKDGMCNYIISSHSQLFDYSSSPGIYISYDFAESKKLFIDYCDQFIKSLFFDLAPLLSIPLYQMHKPQEYIYEKGIYSNYSFYEHEAVANSMNQANFLPRGCDPSLPVMIKSINANKNGHVDHVNFHVYSYKTTKMTDFVPVYGDDGNWHNVPVEWIRYDRIDDDRNMEMAYTGSSRKNFNDKRKNDAHFSSLIDSSRACFFGRGMISMMFDEENKKDINEVLSEVFSDKDNNNQ